MRERTRGIITVVQEHRFKLVNERGVANLFVLAHDAPLEGPELQWLEATQTPVEVTWSRVPNLIANVAHDVRANRSFRRQV